MYKILCAMVLLAVTGCATIMEGDDQSIAVSVVGCEEHGNPICIATNKHNAVKIRTPGAMPIDKGKPDLTVSCESDNKKAKGIVVIDSDWEAMSAGNLILGGFIGIGVDAISGAMWEYPQSIIVEMLCDENGE